MTTIIPDYDDDSPEIAPSDPSDPDTGEVENSPPDPALIRTHLPDAPVAESARVPDSFSLGPDGVGVDGRVLIPAPLVIQARYVDVQLETVDWNLTWKVDGGWDSVTVSRGVALHSRKLPELAARGFPVTSRLGGVVVEYLDQYERINRSVIPTYPVTRRCGWLGTDAFALGSQIITANAGGDGPITAGHFLPTDLEEERLAQALTSGLATIASMSAPAIINGVTPTYAIPLVVTLVSGEFLPNDSTWSFRTLR